MTAQAVAQVNFYGLPASQTAAEREALLPPSGSTQILTTAGVVEETRPATNGQEKASAPEGDCPSQDSQRAATWR